MTRTIIKKRTVYLIAVEGESEQSFIKWLNMLSNQKQLQIHLDCKLLSGGGYRTMLEGTVRHLKRRKQSKSKAKSTILLVDADRAIACDDPWSLDQLREEAANQDINVCVQHPNFEGILLRMLPGNERHKISARDTQSRLRRIWPDYKKPADANNLSTKFKIDDLCRAANQDNELRILLEIIGLYPVLE